MDEINKTLRNITNQMARMKSDPNMPTQPPPRNSSGYRRPNNPQFLQRDRCNEDQTVQTPVRKDINNLEDEEEYLEELPPREDEDVEEQEYLLDEESLEIHLTQDEYDKSEETILDREHEEFGILATQYQDKSDTLLVEV